MIAVIAVTDCCDVAQIRFANSSNVTEIYPCGLPSAAASNGPDALRIVGSLPKYRLHASSFRTTTFGAPAP